MEKISLIRNELISYRNYIKYSEYIKIFLKLIALYVACLFIKEIIWGVMKRLISIGNLSHQITSINF